MTPRLIHVTVLDALGRPVHEARVGVVKAPVALPDVAALSDPAGRVTLSVPAPGAYDISASADGHGSAGASVVVDDRAVQLTIRLPG